MPTRKPKPHFAPIKAKIVAAKNKLRKQKKAAKTAGQHRRIEADFKKLATSHKLLGFGALANMRIT